MDKRLVQSFRECCLHCGNLYLGSFGSASILKYKLLFCLHTQYVMSPLYIRIFYSASYLESQAEDSSDDKIFLYLYLLNTYAYPQTEPFEKYWVFFQKQPSCDLARDSGPLAIERRVFLICQRQMVAWMIRVQETCLGPGVLVDYLVIFFLSIQMLKKICTLMQNNYH